MLKNKKLIAFDADDTLTQTIKTAFQVHKLTASKYYGIELTDDDIRANWGMPFEQFVQILYEDIEPFENIQQNIFKVKSNIPALPHIGAIKTLNMLKKDYLIGLVTASGWEIIRLYLSESGFDLNIFDWFQTAEDTNHHKPNGKVFKPMFTFAKKKGINQNEILYVGDSLQDYSATKDANIDFIAITTGFNTKEEFTKQGLNKKFVINTLSQLIDIIDT